MLKKLIKILFMLGTIIPSLGPGEKDAQCDEKDLKSLDKLID